MAVLANRGVKVGCIVHSGAGEVNERSEEFRAKFFSEKCCGGRASGERRCVRWMTRGAAQQRPDEIADRRSPTRDVQRFVCRNARL
jgi:hypothetical protein